MSLGNDFGKDSKKSSTPRSFVDAKRKEFLSLVQGYMSIAEYEKKFVELTKYVISFIMDEEEKCKCFEGGLRTPI